jgi:hypothetical protein
MAIGRYNVVHRFEKRKLLIAYGPLRHFVDGYSENEADEMNRVNCIAGLSIFFFGYDQVLASFQTT